MRHLICLIALLIFSCQAGAAEPRTTPGCDKARSVVRQTLSLMSVAARDDVEALKSTVRQGSDVAFDELVVIESFDIDDCVMRGDAAIVDVYFDELGEFRYSGDCKTMAFTDIGVREKHQFAVTFDAEGVKLDDISRLAPRVYSEYLLNVLTEIENGDPQCKSACDGLRSRLAGMTSAAQGR